MKKISSILIAIILFIGNLFAQVPEKFNYQVIARDYLGNLIANQNVSFRISILQGCSSDTVAYQEIHQKNTNNYGLVTLAIGNGTVVLGDFPSIGWGNDNYCIQSEIDITGGTSFSFMGSSQLLSVPYALYAQSSSSASPGNNPGDMLYWNGASWIIIPSGSNGQVLTFNSGKPAWGGFAPLLSTDSVTAISFSSATCGGNVTNSGGSPVTARGLCWSTSSNPTTSDSQSINSSGTGAFASNITGLTKNTLYYVRSYATNSLGTVYGNEVNFSTLTYAEHYVGEIFGGGIIFYIDSANQCGLIAATNDQSSGVPWGCYNTLIGTSTAIGTGQANMMAIVNGCGQAGIAARICNDLVLNGYNDWFLPSLEELDQLYLQKNLVGGFGNDYYWSSSEYNSIRAWRRAFSCGYQNYGTKYLTYNVRAIRTFSNAVNLSILNTAPATSITVSSCTCGGNITFDGNTNILERGVCWSTFPDPKMAESMTNNGPGTGVFMSNLTNLIPNTFYYVWAYATNSVGTTYGNEITFTTLGNPIIPTVTTTAITLNTPTSASCGGNVLSNGGDTVSARGVCWSTNTIPTISDSHTSNGNGTGVFVSNIIGLTLNTIYYVRAYATNSIGTAYGNELSFTASYVIGQNYGGGIIFYIDGAGQHGLIAATSDQPGAPWGCQEMSIPSTTQFIGAGQSNTTAIVTGCNELGIAARICDELVLNGYSDWFLPSMDELNQMYLQKTVIGGFVDTYYWTSSEFIYINNAWIQHFVNGGQDIYNKSITTNVRAVRAF